MPPTYESAIRWLGGLLALVTLGVILYGIWRGTKRQAGLAIGLTGSWLRSKWFYFILTVLFLAICIVCWIPLPMHIFPPDLHFPLILGSALYFPGMGLVLWGRLALGKNYYVSTGFGAQLFAHHELVTSGPYALVRHPIYSGLILAAFGSLLIYATWTTVLLTCLAPFMILRARREEAVLEMEFGDEFRAYVQRTGMFFPKF